SSVRSVRGVSTGRPSRRASRSTGLAFTSMPRPAGLGARVYTAAISWPRPALSVSVGTAKSGVPMKTRRTGMGAERSGAPSAAEEAEIHVPVGVLVEQVAEASGAARVACLRAEGAQPHIVAGLHFDPVAVQTIDRLAFQHVEAVLHDMRLGERNDGARLE